ncbi:MAG: MFS transporter [Verrucomicrobia bacterium]|nr:MFS transporter [Verrucomicrobiota bacterium]
MKNIGRSIFASLRRFFSKLPGFSKMDTHSIYFLNGAQFTGVLNDNIFKLVIAYLLIEAQGQRSASAIMSTAGAIFVIPFLLFSPAAGVLADRFSKQRLLVGMKFAEMIIMLLAMVAFAFKSAWGCYSLLFLLSTHSAIFGPSKYAIISQLVPPDRVSRANGIITSFTYLGMILGTFLASFLTDLTNRNFVIVALCCFFIAATGFISTFGIRHTPAQGSQKKIHSFFIKEIWNTLVFCKGRTHLLLAITGSAYFLCIGAFTQLNIIPFAIESLHLSEVAGGYLFLSTAIGIAIGAYIAGKASKLRIELGLSCLAGIAISILLLLMAPFADDLFTVISLLIFLGVCGGLFIVPFDTFTQVFSPDEKRGQIIAASNFLSFTGVLIASFALFFYSEVLAISNAAGFTVMGVITLFLAFFMISRLSDYFLPYISRLFFKPFFRLRAENFALLEDNPDAILILQKASWTKALLLLSIAPKTHLLLPNGRRTRFPWFNWVFYSIHLVPSDETYKPLLEAAKEVVSDTANPCIFVDEAVVPESLESPSFLANLFKISPHTLLYVDVNYAGPGTTISFSKNPHS